MITSLEAKTRFGTFLSGVEAGKEFIITRHDKPVARLVPANHVPAKERRLKMLQRLNAMPKRKTTDTYTLKKLIEEGRK